MAEIVGGFLLPHDPLIFQMPKAAPEAQRTSVHAAYGEIARRIGELEASTVIIVGSDHYMLFGPGCLPTMVLGIGDVEGPLERLPGIEKRVIENNRPLARWLLDYGRREGFDWAVAKSICVDHAIGIPHALCIAPHVGVRTIPVYIASGVEPIIPMSRARALGAMMRAAILAWPEPERVVVMGSGGMSHWVGMAEMGRVNEAFDRKLLDLVIAGDLDRLAALDDAYLLEHGGNGALEVRNFVCAMAAVAPQSGRVIAYEPVPEWITGLGFAELEAAR
jgi:protocatechuate 4,5-dioxygenase beta chain